MNVIDIGIDELRPYANNPRLNDVAVKYVKESIEKFGFKVPIVVDKDKVIVCGHTRYEAAKALHMEKIPCIMADDLSDEQIKAFRLADNKNDFITACNEFNIQKVRGNGHKHNKIGLGIAVRGSKLAERLRLGNGGDKPQQGGEDPHAERAPEVREVPGAGEPG